MNRQQIIKRLFNEKYNEDPDCYTWKMVLERMNMLSLTIFTGIDTPYIGLPMVFFLTLGKEFPYTPPQGCGIIPGLLSSRIHPNIYVKRDKKFTKEFCGEELSPKEIEALTELNGNGVKLCREETAGWENGKGWTPNKDSLTHLALSFQAAFNSLHPLDNEPGATNDHRRGTENDTKFNNWVMSHVLSMYMIPKFWEKIYSREFITPDTLVGYFARNADAIMERTRTVCESGVIQTQECAPSPYINVDSNAMFFCGKYVRIPEIPTLLDKIQENVTILRGLVPQSVPLPISSDDQEPITHQVEESSPVFTATKVDIHFEHPETERDMMDIMIQKSLDVTKDYPFVFPSQVTLKDFEEKRTVITKSEDGIFTFYWRPLAYFSEEERWTFVVWNPVAVIENQRVL